MDVDKEKSITDFYKLGVLNQGEEIITVHFCKFRRLTGNYKRTFNYFWAFVTNQRFILVTNPVASVIQYWDLDKIIWIDKRKIRGIVHKQLSSIFAVLNETDIIVFLIVSDARNLNEAEAFFNAVIEAKEKVIKISSIVTSDRIEKVIVEIKQDTKENPIEILQKRLARGEITLEEFHNIVQRL